jgi:hypothetical protein
MAVPGRHRSIRRRPAFGGDRYLTRAEYGASVALMRYTSAVASALDVPLEKSMEDAA